MTTDELLQRYKPLLKRHWLPLTLGFLGLIFFMYGLIGLFGGKAGSDDIVFESFSEKTGGENEFSQIVVDVEGEVIKPGVYKLSSDSRLQDALVSAGGLSENADREWVAKNLNLAIKIKDGMKIYVPGQGETLGVSKVSEVSIPIQSGSNVSKGEDGGINNQININTASAGELDTLSGVGPVTAQKIIDNRPYSAIEELLEKKVVGTKVFEQIRERITAY